MEVIERDYRGPAASLARSKGAFSRDIEKRTGLLCCYISRFENGHTVQAIETIEKMARALEVPMYQVFYDGDKPPELANLPMRKSSDDIAWGSTGKDARYLSKLRRLLGKANEQDRKLILYTLQKMARGMTRIVYRPQIHFCARFHFSGKRLTGTGSLGRVIIFLVPQPLFMESQCRKVQLAGTFARFIPWDRSSLS